MKVQDKVLRRRKPDEEPREERVEWIDIGPSPRSRYSTAIVVMLVSILMHVGLFYAMPERLVFASQPLTGRKQQLNRDLKLHVQRMPPPVQPQTQAQALLQAAQPPPPPPPPKPEPMNYVEATDAPSNKPDQTDNFSSKSQQLSQKIESRDKTGDTPEVANGEKEDSNSLQTGTGGRPTTIEQIVNESMEKTEADDKIEAQTQNQPVERKDDDKVGPQKTEAASPMPSVLISDNPRSDGKGIAEARRSGKSLKLPDKTPKEREIPAVMTNPLVRMEVLRIGPSESSGMKPQPRPRLNLDGLRPTVLRKTHNGLATPTGYVAFDSKLSEFGNYMDRTFEVIGTKWHNLNEASTPSVADSEVFVRVEFYITKEGQVEDLAIIEATASLIAQLRCTDAIKSNAPYYEWTRDMVVILGDRQPVLVTFYYR